MLVVQEQTAEENIVVEEPIVEAEDGHEPVVNEQNVS